MSWRGSTRVRVIGCGNPQAGDDAAGLAAVRAARSRLADLSGVEVVETGPGAKVLDLLDGIAAAVVVDAVRSSDRTSRPGRVIRVDVGAGMPSHLRTTLSSHGFGLAESVGLAAALGVTPRLAFVGIEAGDLTMGHPLSAAVARALPTAVEAIVTEATALLQEVCP